MYISFGFEKIFKSRLYKIRLSVYENYERFGNLNKNLNEEFIYTF